MKKAEKIVAALLCMVMIMSLAACVAQKQNVQNDVPSKSGNVILEENKEPIAIFEPNTGDKISSRDTVIYGWSNEPSTLDPHMTSDSTALGACYQIYDMLIREEKDGTLSPALCASYEFSNEMKDITFHLREGIKFHNGDVMTADDVVFSLNRSIASAYTTKMTSAFENCEKIDDNTVVLHLKFPYGPAIGCLSNANCAIVNKKTVEADDKWNLNSPVGTGAYMFKSWTTGVELNFEAFPEYYRGEAPIKNLIMRTITDTSALIIALENKEIDFIDTPIMSARQSLMDNPNIRYNECKQACYYLIAFNTQIGHFSNKLVREAVSYAVDRDILIAGALDGVGSAVKQAMVPICFAYDPNFTAHEYDVEKAKALMAEAGYADGFTVKIPTMPGGTYGSPTEILQSMLGEIGINLEIEYLERGTWMSEVLTNNNYEITFWAVPITVNDPDLACYTTFHSSCINGSGNFTNTVNEEIDKLLEEGRKEPDTEKRKEIYTKITEIVRDESYMVPLYTGTRRIAHDIHLQGVNADPVLKYYVYEWYWID